MKGLQMNEAFKKARDEKFYGWNEHPQEPDWQKHGADWGYQYREEEVKDHRELNRRLANHNHKQSEIIAKLKEALVKGLDRLSMDLPSPYLEETMANFRQTLQQVQVQELENV